MNFKDYAYNLIYEGFNPLPLNENKSPKLPKGHKYLYEKVSENDVDSLFQECKKIGIACGRVSDGFYCIDFDKHNGEDIDLIYNQFIKIPFVVALFNQNKLSVYKTMGGGYHFYFRYMLLFSMFACIC